MANWTIFSDQYLVEALGWSVVHSLWQGALLVVLLKGAFRLWPQSSARQRYGLAYGALMAQFMLTIATFSLLYDTGQAAIRRPSWRAQGRSELSCPAETHFVAGLAWFAPKNHNDFERPCDRAATCTF